MPAIAAVGIFVDELRQQVLGVRHLRRRRAAPTARSLSPFSRVDLRHHRDVGRRHARLGRLLELHQPGLAGRLGDRFDLDAGLLGEFREDVLVEGILEVAAIDADLQALRRVHPDRRESQIAVPARPAMPASIVRRPTRRRVRRFDSDFFMILLPLATVRA